MFGIGEPHGKTVMKPLPAALSTATFSATATASAGTPARPVTCSSVTEPAVRTPMASNSPSIVFRP